jgi:hypothetical protein
MERLNQVETKITALDTTYSAQHTLVLDCPKARAALTDIMKHNNKIVKDKILSLEEAFDGPESQIHTKLDAFESHMNDKPWSWAVPRPGLGEILFLLQKSDTSSNSDSDNDSSTASSSSSPPSSSDPKPPSFCDSDTCDPLKYPLMKLSLILLPSAVFRMPVAA